MNPGAAPPTVYRPQNCQVLRLYPRQVAKGGTGPLTSASNRKFSNPHSYRVEILLGDLLLSKEKENIFGQDTS